MLEKSLEAGGRDALANVAPKIKPKKIHSRSYHLVSPDLRT
jgi:hypothetical protein